MGKLLDIEGLKVTEEALKQYVVSELNKQKEEQIIVEDSFLKFPRIGDSNTIYIDKETNYTYRFDEIELKYYVIGTDYNNIEIIDGN